MPYASLDTLYHKLGRKNILHALHGQPTTAGFLANPEGSVMCKKLAGERGTPRAGPGWQSPAEAMPTGGFFGRVRTGYKCDTAGRQWDMTGYESWRDCAARWIGCPPLQPGRIQMLVLLPRRNVRPHHPYLPSHFKRLQQRLSQGHVI